ncbi:uncharacterized protein LOC106875947 [Octopus bimaculoides]|uniref:uncharacterized protein LOC106875947 n=1 Tax=Octopus bimaculoides TaxID=37653 RepID=UPI0022E96CF0|nr:uncharacterized protein LOC106875947 [Octopus bimaculoides]
MEQQNNSTIAVLAHAGHTTNKIVKLLKLPKATIYHVYKQFKERKIDRKNDSKCNPKFLTGLKCSIEANPPTSMTTLAKKHNVSLSTVFRAVNKNLGMTSYVRHCCHLLSTKAKAIRVERCPKFLSSIKHQGEEKILRFVNEKFTVDTEMNHRNSHMIDTILLTSPLCLRLRILPL